MNNKKYLIIYHKEDNDGLFSSALLYFYLIHELKANINNIGLLGADYNELNKISKTWDIKELHEKYDVILMTDISFNDINYMKELYNEFGNDFIWCDHHAPIIKLANQNKLYDIPGVRNIKQSALLCVYDYLYNPFGLKDSRIPKLFKVLSAWDSFTFEENGYTLDYVRNVNVGVLAEFKLNLDLIIPFIAKLMKESNLTVSDVDYLAKICNDKNTDVSTYYDKGKLINNYENFKNELLIKDQADFNWNIYHDNVIIAHDEEIDIPRKAAALFIQGASSSLMFKSVVDPEIKNGIVFKRNKDGSWSISLYNIRNDEPVEEKGGFHCGKFMQKYYNGGGHMGAAGCTVSEEEFLKILKNKYLGIRCDEEYYSETTNY